MRLTAIVLLLAAVPLSGLCYWGIYTQAGRHYYDEMSGIIPMAAGAAAALMVFVAAILFLILWKRS